MNEDYPITGHNLTTPLDRHQLGRDFLMDTPRLQEKHSNTAKSFGKKEDDREGQTLLASELLHLTLNPLQ